MAAIIRVDPDDELPAILERLPSGTPCVVLLPPHARALSSAVGAKLLARRAEALDTPLAVVSDDNAVLAHVRAAGLPVAATLDEAEHLLPSALGDGAGAPTVATTRTTASAPGDAQEGASAMSPRRATPPGADASTSGAGSARPHDAATARFTAGAARAPDVSDGDDAAATAAPPEQIRGHSNTAGRNTTAGSHATGSGPAPTTRPRRSSAGSALPRASRARGTGIAVIDRVIVPALLVLLPLVLILAVAAYVLSGLLDPAATLTVGLRAGAISGNTVVVHADTTPPRKRKPGAYYVPLFFANQAEKGSRTLPVRGVKRLPGHPASGELELGNLTTRPLFVPSGTVFTTALNAEGFASTQAITLPAARESFGGAQWGLGTVPISATLGGTAGNVPAYAIVNVPAQFAGALKLQNIKPTTGGTDILERVVDPRDLQNTAQSLFAALEARGHQDIANRQGGALEQHTLFVARSAIAPVVAPDNRTATLTLSVVVHVAYVRRSALLPPATGALRPALAGLRGASYIPGSIGWTAVWSPDTHHGYTVTLAVTGRTKPNLDIPALRHAVAGLSKTAALAYLNSQPDLTTATIALSPPWADHLPSDTGRIRISPRGP